MVTGRMLPRSRAPTAGLRSFARSDLPLVIAIALVAFLLRLATQMLLGFYVAPEVWEEGEIARRLVDGRGYVFELNGAPSYAFRAPAYAFALAGAYLVFGNSILVAGIFQASLGAALAASVYLIGRSLGGRGVAVLAGLGTAAHPALLVYAAKVHQLNLDVLVAALGTLLILRGLERVTAPGLVVFGAVCGIAILSRPTFVPFLVVGGGAVLVRRSPRPVDGLRRAATVGVVAAALVGPWLAHNYVATGSWTLTTTTGYTLWIGNNPVATGTTITADGRAVIDAAPAMRDLVWGRPETEQDRIFRDAAIRYMTDDLPRTAAAFARKLFYFWWFSSQTGSLYPERWRLAYTLYYAALAVTAVVGANWLARAGGARQLTVLMAAFVTVSLAQSVFYVDGRHRWAVEPLMLVLSAIIVWELLRRLVRKGARGLREAAPACQ